MISCETEGQGNRVPIVSVGSTLSQTSNFRFFQTESEFADDKF